MTANDAPVTLNDAPGSAATVSPGYCSLHPNQRLATRTQVGERVYLSPWIRPPAIACAFPPDDHPDGAGRVRCRWCGGPLYPVGTPDWKISDRRAYCSPNHRLRAFRARAREEAKR